MNTYQRILKRFSGGELPRESLEHAEETATEGVDCVSIDESKLEEHDDSQRHGQQA